MHKRLHKLLCLNNILYDLQFGFRNGFCTNLALDGLLEHIRQSLDDGEYTIGLDLDLSKAFDTVDQFYKTDFIIMVSEDMLILGFTIT